MSKAKCDLSRRFIDACVKRGLSANTVRAYTSDLADFHRAFDPPKSLSNCTSNDIQCYLNGLLTGHRAGARTIRRRLACLKATFKWLLRERLVTENPVGETRLELRVPRQIPRNVPTESLARLLRVANRDIPMTDPDGSAELTAGTFDRWSSRLALELLFSTGIRVGELEQINTGDIDLERGAIRVHGKGARQRNVYVSNRETVAAMRAYIRERPTFAMSTERLLVNRWGRPLRATSVRARLRALCMMAGITQRVTPHMLRHSAATCLMEASVDIRFVQRFLGHASIVTTQIYTHVSDAALRKVVTDADPRTRLLSLA